MSNEKETLKPEGFKKIVLEYDTLSIKSMNVQ